MHDHRGLRIAVSNIWKSRRLLSVGSSLVASVSIHGPCSGNTLHRKQLSGYKKSLHTFRHARWSWTYLPTLCTIASLLTRIVICAPGGRMALRRYRSSPAAQSILFGLVPRTKSSSPSYAATISRRGVSMEQQRMSSGLRKVSYRTYCSNL
jgi:hypothetical protein